MNEQNTFWQFTIANYIEEHLDVVITDEDDNDITHYWAEERTYAGGGKLFFSYQQFLPYEGGAIYSFFLDGELIEQYDDTVDEWFTIDVIEIAQSAVADKLTAPTRNQLKQYIGETI